MAYPKVNKYLRWPHLRKNSLQQSSDLTLPLYFRLLPPSDAETTAAESPSVSGERIRSQAASRSEKEHAQALSPKTKRKGGA